jgi:type I restriction enzyme, R subunit
MQPLVKDPKVTLEQLLDELNDPEQLAAPGNAPDRAATPTTCSNQLGQKLMRVLRAPATRPRSGPKLKAKLTELEQQLGRAAATTAPAPARSSAPGRPADFLRHNTPVCWCNWTEVKQLMGSDLHALDLSQHVDELLVREQSWGTLRGPRTTWRASADFMREAAQPVRRAGRSWSTAPRT